MNNYEQRMVKMKEAHVKSIKDSEGSFGAKIQAAK